MKTPWSKGERDFAISNVRCLYESGSDDEPDRASPDGSDQASVRLPDDTPDRIAPPGDHTYDTRDEPPAFIIKQINLEPHKLGLNSQFSVAPKIMTLVPSQSSSGLNVHVGDTSQHSLQHPTFTRISGREPPINKRVRRSEDVLRAAADCVRRGHTFHTVSQQYRIPISTIRFFMARKGLLPRRRRGRTNPRDRQCTSPEPPYHMQHYKLPQMLAINHDDDIADE